MSPITKWFVGQLHINLRFHHKKQCGVSCYLNLEILLHPDNLCKIVTYTLVELMTNSALFHRTR